MPINSRELLDCVNILLDQEDMKVTIKETGKGTLVCATACFVGGLFGGPIGLAIGGAVGSFTAASMVKGRYKPVSYVIKNLDPINRDILAGKLRNVLYQATAADAITMVAFLSMNPRVKSIVIKTVVDFITNEMHLVLA